MVLDLGAFLISLLSELKNQKVLGIDISTEALKIAKKNAKKYKINNKIFFIINQLPKYMTESLI